MTDRFGGALVSVPLGHCACPGTPHAGGDEASLLPRLSYEGGAAAERTVNRVIGTDPEAVATALCRVYIEHQVSGWNLTDADGAPVPFTAALLLSDWTTSRLVAEAADGLYSEGLLAPLVAAVSTSSPPSQTAPSTSPRTRSASSRRKR